MRWKPHVRFGGRAEETDRLKGQHRASVRSDHTYAAFCIASTADPYAVMRRMGHSSITVTYDTYGHMFPERDVEITDALDGLFQRGVDFLWTHPPSPGPSEASA
jgi:integrase